MNYIVWIHLLNYTKADIQLTLTPLRIHKSQPQDEKKQTESVQKSVAVVDALARLP